MKRRWVALIAVSLAALAVHRSRYELMHALGVRSQGCAANSIIGVFLRPIVDARTGAAIPDTILMRGTLIARDGAYADTTPVQAGAAADRAGTYRVIVRVPGYQPWSRAGIQVRQGLCTVYTTYVRAELEPER